MTSITWQQTTTRFAQFMALTKPRVVSLRPSRVEKLLGVSPKAEEIEKLLAGIELKAASKNKMVTFFVHHSFLFGKKR